MRGLFLFTRKFLPMNSAERIKLMSLCWGDLVALHESTGMAKDAFANMGVVKHTKAWPPVYNQSGTLITDEANGITSMGACYTKPSWEIKIKAPSEPGA